MGNAGAWTEMRRTTEEAVDVGGDVGTAIDGKRDERAVGEVVVSAYGSGGAPAFVAEAGGFRRLRLP